jgi:DNA repair protein RadC
MRQSWRIGQIRNPHVVWTVMGAYAATFDEERTWILALDVHGYLRAEPQQIAQGGASYVVVDLPSTFRRTIALGSSFFVLTHNHPTGSAWPSHADWVLTHNVAEQGAQMQLLLLDHVVLGLNEYYSFREQKLWRLSPVK